MATTPDHIDLAQQVNDLRTALQQAKGELSFAAGHEAASGEIRQAERMMATAERADDVLRRTAPQVTDSQP
jgi:hypothetical protein